MLLAAGLGLQHCVAVGCHFVAQPVIEELLAELGERLRVGLRQLCVPADLVRDLRARG